MKVYEISEDNLEEFSSYIGADLADDMKRSFYRGFGAKEEDGSVKGVLVYELHGVDNDDEDMKSSIRFLKAESQEAYDKIQQIYRDEGVPNDEIAETSYRFEEEEPAESCAKHGFSKEQRESELIRLTLKDVIDIDFVNKMKKIPDYIVSLQDLSMIQFRTVVRNCLLSGQKGLLEDLGYLSMGWFDINVSACTITDGEVKGLFLVRVTPNGIITPVMLHATGADFRLNLARMLAYSIKKGAEKYRPETEILINCARKPTEALVKKLLPVVKANTAFYGCRKEE